MNILLAIVGIIGAIASIIGAILAVKQARKAKRSADEAQRFRDQVISHRQTSELSHLDTLVRRAQNSMAKYGPASTSVSLTGVSPDRDAQDVQECLLALRQHRIIFGKRTPNAADKLANFLSQRLDDFSRAADTKDHKTLREKGKEILMRLADFQGILKKRIDDSREQLTP